MKKLILALAFLAFSVQAEQWFEMPNQAGGKIMLLTGKCIKSEGYLVIATTPSGPNVHGCWWAFANMVHIVWEDTGKSSSFDANLFKHMSNDKNNGNKGL